MNIGLNFDIAAVFLSVSIFISFILRKTTKGSKNMMYLAVNGLILGAAILDIITMLFGSVFPANEFTLFEQALFNYMYFIVRNATPPTYIIYSIYVLGRDHIIRESLPIKLILNVPYIIIVLMLVMNPWNSCVFYFDDNCMYQRGPYISVIYAMAFFYLIAGMFIIIKNWAVMRPMQSFVLMAFIPITALAVAIQLFIPELRLEIFSSALMLIFVALGIQRPEENLDEAVGALNYNAFLNDMREYYISGKPVSVLFVKLKNHSVLRQNLGIEKYVNLISSFYEKLNRVCLVMELFPDIYYLDRGVFAVVTNLYKKDKLKDAARLANAYSLEPFMLDNQDLKIEIKAVMVDVPVDIDNYDRFINFTYSIDIYSPDSNMVMEYSSFGNNKSFLLKSNLDNIIFNAINHCNFEMYYQPIYSIKTKKFSTAEALIRLRDPEYGFVSPAIFIPAAELSGAIHKIGEFVLDEVCRFINEQNLISYGVNYIEINLSVAQCLDAKLVNKLFAYVKKHRLNPQQINLEITETAVDSDSQITNENINKLHEMGFAFSIDDFGTGYSNVNRIAELPVNIVKLDKSLVDAMDSEEMWTIIESMVAMLKKLNKKILVEGVETKEAFDRFSEIGCDYIQGYYFSKPIPEKVYLEFLKVHNCQ